MTLGEFCEALESAPQEVAIRFTLGLYPGRFGSYRGYYDQLAIDATWEYRSVGSVLAEARAAIGQVFQGYKGGNYTMTTLTPLWVAPWGQSTGVAVVGVYTADNGDRVIQTWNEYAERQAPQPAATTPSAERQIVIMAEALGRSIQERDDLLRAAPSPYTRAGFKAAYREWFNRARTHLAMVDARSRQLTKGG